MSKSQRESMAYPSYPIPPRPLELQPLRIRALPPLLAPPLPAQLPRLPCGQRRAAAEIAVHYELSTHLVPAAHPRLTPDVPAPPPPVWSADKAQYQASVQRTLDAILRARRQQWAGELPAEGSRTLLWNCIDRYVRRKGARQDTGRPPVTLFCAHANGFPKETWEVALAHLLTANEASKNPVDIVEIWLWEAVNHGDSALVNAGKLGGIYDWADNSRDILNFLLHHLPTSPAEKALPLHLPRLAEAVSESRKTFGFQSRTFVGVGHSFGGCTTYRAAVERPSLFASLVLLDPILSPFRPGQGLLMDRQFGLTSGAIRRRSHWSSREEALKSFQQTPFFASWDPAVLKLYVDHGIYDDPQGGVSLKTSGVVEGMLFSEALASYEMWQLASTLPSTIEIRYIMPGRPNKDEIPREYLIWLRPENASNVIIPRSGHLIVQEAPRELAGELLAFLTRKYGRNASPPARL
ncbi:alpha/beta hydrolase [Phanerochaete sordida]|uniref:Alpha/beta hydrolase n=1 Tax=Phanerochaete sordida TaxID=48140 RepID=A0A9P3GPZ4_9APHY|nr:alpha/beta hydrolase [Phanerochaete sordida]